MARSSNDDVFGPQHTTAEDRAYRGSRYAEVRDAIFANPYQRVWGAPGEPRLPVYGVTLRSVVRGVLPFGGPHLFRQAVARAIDSHADLRWGHDRKGYRRLLHPNAVCLTGTWEVAEETGYSGYFRKGSRALVVGRYSTCCGETRRGRTRSLSLVGKLYPTTDPNHAEPLRTANFITQQDIGGDFSRYANDAHLLNAPDTRVWRRGIHFPILVITGVLFGRIDRQPSVRQLYPIAELGKSPAEPTLAPQFMRLRVAANQPRVEGDDLDFRDEILAQILDKGDPAPRRALSFDIDVTDEGSTRGPAVFQRRTFTGWRTIGSLRFDNAVASYNGDHVVHFNHPTWRDDRNDPATATRVGERKVR